MTENDFHWDGAPGTAILRMPKHDVRAALVALPGAGDGGARQPLFEQISRSLAPIGIAVLGYERRAVDEGDTPSQCRPAADAVAATVCVRLR